MVDTSALTAILLGEVDAPALVNTLGAVHRIGLCAPSRAELLVIIQARVGDAGVQRARHFLDRQQMRAVALDDGLADWFFM